MRIWRLAVSRAIAIETPRGWRIAKEKTSHKIDAVVALAMAALAAVEEGQRSPVPLAAAYPVDSGLSRCSMLSNRIGAVARVGTDGEGAVACRIQEVVFR